MYKEDEFWKNYMDRWFGAELIGKWSNYARVTTVDSARGPIRVEVYHTGDACKPTLVFSHGIAGYARLLLPFIIPLFEKGFNALTADPTFNSLLMKDPYAGHTVTLRGALSLITDSKPDTDHTAYEKPVLLCNPEQDEMTPGIYTRRVFEKLGSKDKKYVGFQTAHFPLDKPSFVKWAECVESFVNGLPSHQE